MDERRDPPRPHRDEGAHDRRDDDLAAPMGLLEGQVAPPGVARLELERAAQRAAAHARGRLAELLGEANQRGPLQLRPRHAFRRDAAAHVRLAEDRLDERPDREDGQQRDDVGEGLVERRLVGQPRLDQVRPQPVEDGVCHLVRDDVVREARLDRAPGQLEVAEEDAAVVAGVVRVRLGERVRDEEELVAAEGPRKPAAERLLERRQRPRGDRVDVLGVELEIGDQHAVARAREAVEIAPGPLGARRGRVAQVDRGRSSPRVAS